MIGALRQVLKAVKLKVALYCALVPDLLKHGSLSLCLYFAKRTVRQFRVLFAP